MLISPRKKRLTTRFMSETPEPSKDEFTTRVIDLEDKMTKKEALKYKKSEHTTFPVRTGQYFWLPVVECP